MLEQKAAGFWDEVDERIEKREQAVSRVEAKVVGWIGEGQQLVEEWIEKGAYNEQHKGIAEQWIDGTVLDNQYVHELLDIMDQGRQLSSHFEAGVARGLVDTAASVLEAGVAGAAEFAKHDPVIKTIKAVEYGAEVASSDHPLEKVETDAWQAGQEAVSVVKRSVKDVKNAVVDTVHEFEHNDINHRAGMLGYGLEKAAELFAGGAVLKSALTAEKAAAEAAKLRSTVIANIDESKAAREASRFSEYIKSERQLADDLAAKRRANKVENLNYAQKVETFQARSQDIRHSLPNKYKNYGNVAVADVNIPGLKTEFKAHSRIHKENADGFSSIAEEGRFPAKSVNQKGEVNGEGAFPRDNDTERKILEDIAYQLGNNKQAAGTIDLFTELPACGSCSDVILKFRQEYPNIQLNVYSGEFAN